jgi:hypothetical protein
MQNQSIILQALAAGAAAAFRPNLTNKTPVTERGMNEKYEMLKATLRQNYPQVEIDLLDVGPASAERQERVAAQLEAGGALADEELQAQAAALLAEIYEQRPGAATAVGLHQKPDTA